jgi:hypothetical protein
VSDCAKSLRFLHRLIRGTSVPIISTTTAIEIQSQEDPFLAVTAGIAAAASGVLVVSEGAPSVAGSLAASATGVAVSADGAAAAGVAESLG